MKISYLKTVTISLGLLSSYALFAQSYNETGGQNCLSSQNSYGYSNINEYIGNKDESSFQNGLAPQMQMNPEGIAAEVEVLTNWFGSLGIQNIASDAAKEAAKTAVEAKAAGINAKEEALKAAEPEIGGNGPKIIGEGDFQKPLVYAESIRAFIKDISGKQFQLFKNQNFILNSNDKIWLAQLAQVYENAIDDALHAEAIWEAIADKKKASFKDKEQPKSVLKNVVNFSKLTLQERVNYLFEQADIALEGAIRAEKYQEVMNQYARRVDQAKRIFQYFSAFGVSLAIIPESIQMYFEESSSNILDDNKKAENMEKDAKNYCKKIAKREAAKERLSSSQSTESTWKQRVTESYNLQENLKIGMKITDSQNADHSRIIDRKNACYEANRTAWEIFWPEEAQSKISVANVGIISTASNSNSSAQSSSSSSSSSNSRIDQNNETAIELGQDGSNKSCDNYQTSDMVQDFSDITEAQIAKNEEYIETINKQQNRLEESKERVGDTIFDCVENMDKVPSKIQNDPRMKTLRKKAEETRKRREAEEALKKSKSEKS